MYSSRTLTSLRSIGWSLTLKALLPVSFPPVGNAVNKDTSCLIVNSIKHPVIPDPETVTFFSLKFIGAGRPGTRFQSKDFIADTLVYFGG